LIVDERNSGCGASGKGFWAYDGPSDYVVFGKRTQIEGYFSTHDSKKYALTSGGDQFKLLQFKAIKEVIDGQHLVKQVDRVGQYLQKQLNGARADVIRGVRGSGTSLYIDTAGGDSAKKLQQSLLKNGVIVKLNGDRGIALKPSLLFEERHVDQFIRALKSSF
jgi:4-aminobutyrate aminotransferase-like enzyme